MSDTIPLRYAQSLLRLSAMPREQLRKDLATLKLPAVLLESQAQADARISVEDYGRLFVHLVLQLQDHLPGQIIDPEDARSFSAFRMMFLAMIHSRDLGQALLRAAIYFRRMSSGDYFELEQDGDLAWCRFVFDGSKDLPLSDPGNFTIEQLHWLPGATGKILSMAMWHRLCSWFIGSYIELQAVQLCQPAVEGKDYREVFGHPAERGAPRDALAFESRYLAFPIVQDEHALNQMLATYPADLFRLGPGEHSLAARVRGLIGNNFNRPLPTLQAVADCLQMSTPTLHRRLREEGTSFQQLKDDCRRDAAIAYLASGDYTSAELSELLGFSESSTFNRAFKKWTGLTPGEYRRQSAATK